MSENAKRKWERRSADFRESALERMKNGENVRALARELGVPKSLLYWWKQRAEGRLKSKEPGTAEDPRDRRVKELEKKVSELEGAIGQETLELDFFAGALRSCISMAATRELTTSLIAVRIAVLKEFPMADHTECDFDSSASNTPPACYFRELRILRL